jgi:hypothetical protein
VSVNGFFLSRKETREKGDQKGREGEMSHRKLLDLRRNRATQFAKERRGKERERVKRRIVFFPRVHTGKP